MEKLFESMEEGEAWFHECFGKDKTFDAEARVIHLWDTPALLLYINGLVDDQSLLSLLTRMQWNERSEALGESDRFLSYFPYQSVTEEKIVQIC